MRLNVVRHAPNRVALRNVLVSVADKSGLEDLVPHLLRVSPQLRIFSTGGTYTRLTEVLADQDELSRLSRVSDFTGQPEMQGGLVKTLDYKIYLALLSETDNPAHQEDLRRTGAVPIDMVVVNLYPFEQTVAQPDVTVEAARGNIDIGGPCMLRAAAKNFLRVAAVSDPADYRSLMEETAAHEGTLSLATRFALAQKAFAHTAAYDQAIASHLAGLDAEAIGAAYG